MGLADLPTLADQGRCARQKWEMESRVDEQATDAAVAAATTRTVYAQVTAREGQRCRICDKWCNPTATTLLAKGHHHHIVYESACGPTTIENVCYLCATCHNAEHQHRIEITGNAQDAPWLTLRKKDIAGEWYVWKQEIGIREYEKD